MTFIRSIAKDTHKRTYGPLAVVSVVITTIGMFVAIALFSIFLSKRSSCASHVQNRAVSCANMTRETALSSRQDVP